jgi:hypothetical protein
MQLRNNIILKLLALLLFSLELIAPVFAQAGTGTESTRKASFVQIQFQKQASRQILLFSDNEESSEEREAGQKDLVLYVSPDFFHFNHHITLAAPVAREIITRECNFDTRPPLYAMHCLYRI